MTIGTATVARMKVRRTALRSASEGPMVRFSTVRVGKTGDPDHERELVLAGRSDRCGGGLGVSGGHGGVPSIGVSGSGLSCAVVPRWFGRDRLDREPEPEVGDGDRDVLVDEVVVDGDGGGGAFAGGGDDLGTGVDRVPGRPDAGNAGARRWRRPRPSRCRGWRSRGRRAGCRWGRTGGGRTRRRAARRWPSVELDAGEAVVVDDEAGDGLVHDADGAGGELFTLLRRSGWRRWRRRRRRRTTGG